MTIWQIAGVLFGLALLVFAAVLVLVSLAGNWVTSSIEREIMGMDER